MKNFFYSIVFVLLAFQSFAQNEYDKGYYIDDKGIKVEGYLEIVDFNNINQLQNLCFKKELTSEVVKLNTHGVVEFAIDNELKFKKTTFLIDNVNFYKSYTNQKDLHLEQVKMFLNILVEGDVSLYSFYDGSNGTKYFYSVKSKDIDITQLEYKKYMGSGDVIKENNNFREQLFKDVKCDNQSFNEFINLKYDRQQLVSIFQEINQCKNDTSIVYKNKFSKSKDIYVTGILGINQYDSNFTGFGAGVEGELLFPFEKCSVFLKLKYESFRAENTQDYYSADGFNHVENVYDTKYNSFDLIFGFRYYCTFNKTHKIFLNANGGINSPTAKVLLTTKITNGGGSVVNKYNLQDNGNSFFPGLGVGYTYKNKFGIDLEFDFQKKIFASSANTYAIKYNKIGVNFRYTFN